MASIQLPPNSVTAYVGAILFFGDNNDLLTVWWIQNGIATCCFADDDRNRLPPINLPREYYPLIARFGHR